MAKRNRLMIMSAVNMEVSNVLVNFSYLRYKAVSHHFPGVIKVL